MAAPDYDWYLREWLSALDCTQARLRDETGWTVRIASQLVNRKTRWNRDHLNAAAHALNLQAWELLMHPQDAMEIRQLRNSVTLAAERRMQYIPKEDDVRFTGTDK